MTVAVCCSKNKKIPIICSNLALCNSNCNLQLAWTRLKAYLTTSQVFKASSRQVKTNQVWPDVEIKSSQIFSPKVAH